MAEYMSRFVGEEFEGTISSVLERGFFVRLANSAEGFVPYEDFPGDDFEYDGIATFRSPSTRRTFRVGDRVRVQVAAAKIATGKVTLRLTDEK